MNQRLFFFLGKESLGRWLQACELEQPMRFTARYSEGAEQPTHYESVSALPSLGTVTDDFGGPNYLVTPGEIGVHMREIHLSSGAIRHCAMQDTNPQSVIARFGGEHPSGTVVAGEVNSLRRNLVSGRLISIMERELKRVSRKKHGYWIDEESWTKAAAGRRLTTNASISPDYDPRIIQS